MSRHFHEKEKGKEKVWDYKGTTSSLKSYTSRTLRSSSVRS